MPAKTEKTKVLHHLEVSLQPLTIQNEPVANITDGNVELDILSHILDNFQILAEIVLDRLPKSSSRVDFVTDISKENSIKFFGHK